MTFVPQPYEQFVDDLLTTLTGGHAREEHRFTGHDDEIYHLNYPYVESSSIKVVGQRNETFARFNAGIDFVHDNENEGIRWLSDGGKPDLRSYFYVSYEQEDARRVLTNRNIGGPTATLAEAFSKQYAVFHQQLKLFYDAAYVMTANNSALDHIAELLAITRKDARFAMGEVLLTRRTAAPADIAIPAGTLVSTAQGEKFLTTSKRLLRRGQLSVAIPIRAEIEGPRGGIDAGQITVINRPIFGIDSCTNERATFFANDRESDDEFRTRIVGTIERAGRSTINAIKFGLIEQVPEINEANIQVKEVDNQQGVVDVRLAVADYDEDFVRRVEASIFEFRPAGIVVRHNLRSQATSSYEKRAAAELGSADGGDVNDIVTVADNAGADADNSNLPIGVDAAIRLANENLAVSQRESLQDELRQRIVDYIESLPLGEDIIYNQLVTLVLQSEEIADVNLTLRIGNIATDSNPDSRANIRAGDKKATITTGDIDVRLMTEHVYLDVLINLKPTANASNDIVPNVLYEAISASINRQLVATTAILRVKEIRASVEDALQDHGSEFRFADEFPIVVNAEFQETGLRTNNTSEVSRATHQELRLRNFSIDSAGELDG